MQYNKILITGASSGFGLLTSTALAKRGHTVIATMRNLNCENAINLISAIKDQKLNIHIKKLDVTNMQEIEALQKDLAENDLLPDVIINNAGYGYLGPVETISDNDLAKQFETNVFGVVNVTKAFTPHMRKNKKGRIINISSIAGLISFPLYGIYSASKFALESISEALDFELSPFNIKVVLVEPGSFETDFGKNRVVAKTQDIKEYETLVDTFEKKFSQKGPSANPQTVVNTIVNIVESENPKIRYLVGTDAKIYNILHKLIPYKIWKLLLQITYGYK